MKTTTILFAAALTVTGFSAATAQNAPAEPGVPAPGAARALPNGEVAPPPAARAGGGTGATEIPFDNAQTKSGGPSGGSIRQTQ